jgi:hypothetical protein
MSELFVVLGLLTFSWMNVIAQSKTQETPRTAATNAKPIDITGMSFDEKLFVSDEDMKIWTVTNPKALKGHAGHHARITAQVDTTRNAIVVKSIRLLPPAIHEMPSNNDYRLDILPEPFPDYLRRGDIPIK